MTDISKGAVERLSHDFKVRLDLIYQKAYEYKSIANDENVAHSIKQSAKMELDSMFYRLTGDVMRYDRIALYEGTKSTPHSSGPRAFCEAIRAIPNPYEVKK